MSPPRHTSSPTLVRTVVQKVLPGSFYELLIAWRIIRARKKKSLSVITVISITGIILGVMALTIVLGITDGFRSSFRERILGMYPHMVILERAGDFDGYRRVARLVRSVPGVVGVSPATSNEMMATSEGRRSGAVVKGIDLATVDSVSNVRSLMVDGSLDGLDETPTIAADGAGLRLGGLVGGSSWLVVAEDGGAFAVPDDTTRPDLGLARLRLLNLDPASAERGIDPGAAADGLPPDLVGRGEATPYLDLRSGDVEVQILGGGRKTVATVPVHLDVDASYTLVWTGRPDGAPQLVPDPPGAPGEEQSRVRLLDLRAGTVSLTVVGPDAVPAATVVAAPGGTSDPSLVAARLPGIVLGAKLAQRLDATPGDVVTLVSPLRGIDNKMLGPFGMAPTSARYRVVGIFDSGFHEYDVRLTLVEFHAAQRFLNRGDVAQWLDVRFDDVLQVKRRARDVKGAVDPYSLPDFLDATAELERRLDRVASGDVTGYPMERPADVYGYLRNATGAMQLMSRQALDFGLVDRYRLIDWEEMNHNLFSALKLQKVVLSIFFLIIIVVAAFNVVGSQIMIVHEKTANIAILKSMGAPSKAVRKIFLLQGLIVSTVGTLTGLALGLVVCLLIQKVGYPLDPEVYLIRQLPVVIDLGEFALVAAGGLAFTFGAIQYSARRAAQKTPVEGLRKVE